MDEEEVPVDTGKLGALGAMGGIDFGKLRDDPASVLQAVLNQQMAAQEAEKKTLAEFYEKGRANIIARNQGPSTSEQLFALSKALLAPREHRGIAGTIGKISGAFGDISEAQRKATLSREEQLAKFDEAYGMRRAGLGTQNARTAADLVRTAGSLLKPKDSRQYDMGRGIFVDKSNIRPTQNTYDIGNGRVLVQWQDGLWREELPSGGYKVFERAGNNFNEVGIEEADNG
jgi:hypothetical protein